MEREICTSLEKGHIRSIDFSHKQAKQILSENKILTKLVWDKIPDVAVITGKNGAGKTKILEYMAKVLSINHPKVSVLHEYDVQSSGSEENVLELPKDDKSIKPKLKQAIKKYNEGGSKLSTCLGDLKIHDELKERIKRDFSQQNHEENYLDLLIDSYVHDYYKDTHDLNYPIETLCFVFKLFDQNYESLKKKYSDLKYLKELKQFRLEQYPIETDIEIFQKLCESEFLKIVTEDFIRKKLQQKPPWEEVNNLIKKELQLKLIWSDSGDISKKKITFRHKNRINIDLSFQDLSLGEKLVINLIARVFYFQGFNAQKVASTNDIKKVNIMLLDEPDCHLDPQFCKLLHNVIHNIFVKKCDIQVIMTTHRLDTVKLTKENSVFVMKSEFLKCNKDSAIKRMLSYTNRKALSILSNGELTVNSGSNNYVYVENEDDRLFYYTIYERFKTAKLLKDNYTKLVFIPVGISVIQTENIEKLQKAASGLKPQIEELKNIFENLENKAVEIKSILYEYKKDYAQNNAQNIERNFDELKNKDEDVEEIQKSDKTNNMIRLILQALDNKKITESILVKHTKTAEEIQGVITYLKNTNDTGGGVDQIRKKLNPITLESNNDDKGNLKDFKPTKVNLQNSVGLADGDGSIGANSSQNNLFQIKLYSIECYLCMPINLLFMLKKYRQTVDKIIENIEKSKKSKKLDSLNSEETKIGETLKIKHTTKFASFVEKYASYVKIKHNKMN